MGHPHPTLKEENHDEQTGLLTAALLTVAAASLISTHGRAATSTPVNARNVVLVHGLFADGSAGRK
jgi:hypothetical protein